MPVFKNESNGTWYVMARYVNWKGERKQKCKRGFSTKKEAQEWERMFQLQNSSDMDMSFEAFTELYIRDMKSRLKENTWLTKEHIIRTKILPYFGKLKISEISTKEVIAWQNEMLAYRDEKKKPYSQTYLKTLHNQLSAIFNHAVRYYELRSNPAAKAGNMGSEEHKEMLFWTKEEYKKFSFEMMDKPVSFYAFGTWKGEMWMQIYGYHRTSTKEQHLDRGIQEIERYCNEHEMALTNIFTDQETGKNFNRPRYTVLVEDVLRPGDILIVTELDRLGRNKYDTMQQIQRIKNMGVRLMVLELPTTLMDLSVMDNAMARMMLETINNMMLELYASMAQAELEKKEKRQREGIEAKKLRGEWDDYGRPSVMKQETFDENFQSVVSGETTPTQLRKNLGMTHSTFYRYRKTFYEKYPELSNSAN